MIILFKLGKKERDDVHRCLVFLFVFLSVPLSPLPVCLSAFVAVCFDKWTDGSTDGKTDSDRDRDSVAFVKVLRAEMRAIHLIIYLD